MQNDELGLVGNLRREGVVRFHRGPGKVRTARDEYFFSRVIHFYGINYQKKAKVLRPSLNDGIPSLFRLS